MGGRTHGSGPNRHTCGRGPTQCVWPSCDERWGGGGAVQHRACGAPGAAHGTRTPRGPCAPPSPSALVSHVHCLGPSPPPCPPPPPPVAVPPPPPPPPCVTFRLVVVSVRGPGQSPVLPFACCVGSLLSVGRCGRCSCWCRFHVRRAQ